MSWGIDLCSLAAGGYGLAKGSMKALQWGANAWKVQRGTYVAAEKLGQPAVSSLANHRGWVLPKAGGTLVHGRWYTEHALA